MTTPTIVSNILTRETAASSPASSFKAPTATETVRRAGIFIKNSSTANDLWVVQQISTNATPPTITEDDNDFVIGPGETLVLDIANTISAWVQSSAGVDNYTVVEFE